VGLIACNTSISATIPKDVNFKIVTVDDLHNFKALLPDNRTAIHQFSMKGGVFPFYDDKDLIIFIGLGEKKTAGYGIKIRSIQSFNKVDNFTITIVEIKPTVDQFVAQVISYPYILIDLGPVKLPKTINLLDHNGNKLNEVRQ